MQFLFFCMQFFACILLSTDFFSLKINFNESYWNIQIVKLFVSNILSGLIWAQTVCKRLSAADTS